MRAMGSNALPVLLEDLRAQPGRLEPLARNLRRWTGINLQGISTEQRRAQALEGFRALGPLALPAAPTLVDWLGQGDLGFELRLAIIATGPESVPLLIPGLRNSDPLVRSQAAECLGLLGQSATNAVLDLIPMFKDPDPEVRRSAAKSLGDIQRNPEACVPALTDALEDKNAGVRAATIVALRRFGKLADAAAPALRKRLADADDWELVLLKQTLREIEAGTASDMDSR